MSCFYNVFYKLFCPDDIVSALYRDTSVNLDVDIVVNYRAATIRDTSTL
jgi:hypothetical protein